MATPINLATTNSPELLAKLDAEIPLGRLAEPEEIASIVAYLASDESAFATGAEFIMDGGLITDVNHKEF